MYMCMHAIQLFRYIVDMNCYVHNVYAQVHVHVYMYIDTKGKGKEREKKGKGKERTV